MKITIAALVVAGALVLTSGGLPSADAATSESNASNASAGAPAIVSPAGNGGAIPVQLAAVEPGERRIALVIGNANYPNLGSLKNPVNDARAISERLRNFGFEVMERVNLDQKQMKRAIIEFGKALEKGGTGLFYYAGHGVQVDGYNYLIPVNAPIENQEDVDIEAISVGAVLAKMEGARNPLNIVILDACRNNPFTRSFRATSRGLAQMDAPTGTLIAYAAAPGGVAIDGEGQNGLYTSALLDAMKNPGIKIEDVMKRVRVEVRDRSNGGQVPWESSSLTGDFYFQPPQATAAPAAQPPQPVVTPQVSPRDDLAIELAFWDAIKNSGNAADYSAYLERFPDGNFASLARARLNSIAPEVATVRETSTGPDQIEIAFWDSIKDSTTLADYEAYLTQYPSGYFSTLAEARYTALMNAAQMTVTAAATPEPPPEPAPTVIAPAETKTALAVSPASLPKITKKSQILDNDDITSAIVDACERDHKFEILDLYSVIDLKSSTGTVTFLAKFRWTYDFLPDRAGRASITLNTAGADYQVARCKAIVPTLQMLLRLGDEAGF